MILNLSPVRILAMALAFPLTATVVVAQENLVPNPSFESLAKDAEVKDIKKFGLLNEYVTEWAA